MAQTHIYRRFAWQAWDRWHWVARLDWLGRALVARDAAAFCVAGVALGDIHFRSAWQAWHKLTSTVVLRGRRGTDGTGWIRTAPFSKIKTACFQNKDRSLKNKSCSLTKIRTGSFKIKNCSLTKIRTAHSLTHPLIHSLTHSLTVHEHTYTHTNSPTITDPSLLYFLFPSCFSMLSLSLKKLVTCGVIRSFNFIITPQMANLIPCHSILFHFIPSYSILISS